MQDTAVSPILSDEDVAELRAWRHELHRRPELSGEEAETAARVIGMLEPSRPDRILSGLGGHGVAATYSGAADGPTVMLRCELDALPIDEISSIPHISQTPGKAHLCGHDGHMAILAGVARFLGRNRPARGRAVLLFQPAEENGAGAAAVIADPRFAEIRPDYAFALHNFPGLPLGHVVLEAGIANCASRGMKIELGGRTAHASQPETGISPAPALARLIRELTALGAGESASSPDFSLVTITHAGLGEPAFGVAPGAAHLWATLRTQVDARMDALVAQAEAMVAEAASEHGLDHRISYHDVFRHCANDPDATAILAAALGEAGLPSGEGNLPMRASEDFGRFGDHAKAAMFLLGSGTDSPALHNPDFDFPDELIEPGVRAFVASLKTGLYEV